MDITWVDNGETEVWERLIPTDSIKNFRDLGNYTTIDGTRIIKKGRVFRAADSGKATPGDAKVLLEEKDIRTWIDFRGKDEGKDMEYLRQFFDTKLITRTGGIKDIGKATKPDEQKPRIRYTVDLDYAGAVKRFFRTRAKWYEKLMMLLAVFVFSWFWRYSVFHVVKMFFGRVGLEGLNITFLEECKPQLATALKIIASEQHGALVNCVLGKDRTGTISALILLALEIPTERVAADYALTEKYLTREYISSHLSVVNLDSDTLAGAKKGTMQSTIAFLVINYGSIEQYLDGIGFGVEWRKKMKDNFTLPLPTPSRL